MVCVLVHGVCACAWCVCLCMVCVLVNGVCVLADGVCVLVNGVCLCMVCVHHVSGDIYLKSNISKEGANQSCAVELYYISCNTPL